MSQSPANLVAVRCPCGAKLRVKPEGLGRKARCPKCSEVFVVAADAPSPPPQPAQPAGPAPDSLLDELAAQERTAQATAQPRPTGGARACPQCGNRMPADAVVCVSCGYNLQTGKILKQASAKRAVIGGFVRRLASGAGTFVLGCVFSAIAAMLGAALWFGVAIVAKLEIGWIAWGLGVLAGAGMLMGYQKQNARAGLAASGIALCGIVTAKLFVFLFVIRTVITEDPTGAFFQRELVKASLTRALLWNSGVWAEHEQQDQWDAAYEEAHRLVSAMPDDEVEQQAAAMFQGAERESDMRDVDGRRRLRLARAWTWLEAERRRLRWWDPSWYELYDEQVGRAEEIDGAALADAVTELKRWEAGERWEDEEYVGAHLAHQLVDRDTAARRKPRERFRTPSEGEWVSLHSSARDEVDGMEPQERVAESKRIEQEVELPKKRARLAAHRAEMVGMELGLAPNDDRRRELYDQARAECEQMGDDETLAAIADLNDWEVGGKWDDPVFVRNHLVYLYADDPFADLDGVGDSEADDDAEPPADDWRGVYEDAVATVDAIPPDERLAVLHRIEDERRQTFNAKIAEIQRQARSEMAGALTNTFFSEMFAPMDGLFMLFAVISAYGIAAGTGEEEYA